MRQIVLNWKLYALATLVTVILAACPADVGRIVDSRVTYSYVCSNGTAPSGRTITEGTEQCVECNSGFAIENNLCVPDSGFAYICNNGISADGTTDTANTERCRECDTGFELTANARCNALCSENNGTHTLAATAGGIGEITFRMITVPIVDSLNFSTGVNDDGDATIDSPYSIAETELTYALYKRIRDWAVASEQGATRYELNLGRAGSAGGDGGAGDGNANHPVTNISWYDSVKFANALSEYCGLTPVYLNGSAVMRTGTANPTLSTAANGFRLPESNEWELAARYIGDMNNDGDIKDSGEYYPGNYASGATDDLNNAPATGEVAWYGTNSNNRTNSVKGKTANALGLYDMSGNVWEWAYDPIGYNRVIRGGAWNSFTRNIQVGYAYIGFPSNGSIVVGVRLVR